MPGGQGYQQQQVRITQPYLNRISDPAPGVVLASSSFAGGIVQPYAGMVGSKIFYDADQMLKLSDPLQALFGGAYQYVKYKSTDAAPVQGQIVFWDKAVAEDLYQVTSSEAGTVDTASLKAGIIINLSAFPVVPGNYIWIQVAGKATVLFRAVLSNPGQTGSPVFLAAAGAGADNGTADVIGGGGAATVDTVADANQRFLGWAETAPVGGALSIVNLAPLMVRQ